MPGGLGKFGLRPDSETENDQVSGQFRAIRQVHRGGPALAGPDRLCPGAEGQTHAQPTHRLRDVLPDVRIERLHRRLRPVHHGDLKSSTLGRLGQLHPDVAGADHRHPSRRGVRDRRMQSAALTEGLHAEDPGRIDAGDRRPDRHGSRSDHQLVVALPAFLPDAAITDPDPSAGGVDLLDLVAGPDLDRGIGPELLGGSHHQFVLTGDLTADPIGDAARRPGRVGTPLESADFQLVGAFQAAGLRGCGHPGGIATDHDQPLSHLSSRSAR